MIIDRIIAVRVTGPKLVTTLVPVGCASRDEETVRTVEAGVRTVQGGASGTTLDVSFEEIDIELYTPQNAFVERLQIRPV